MKSKILFGCGLALVLLSGVVMLSACTGDVYPSESDKPDKAMHRSQKRGVAFSFARTDDAMLLSPSISWWYNWGPDSGEEGVNTWFALDSVVFLPMAWNGGFDSVRISNYVTAHPETKYLLAFNEPNLNDQARLTPEQAAERWPRLMRLARALNLKVVSPAMNYGTLDGYHNPIKWLDEFFACDGVSVEDVDVIAIHCYMSSVDAVENYIKMFEKYQKPIWMTEFCAWDPVPGNVQTQLNYMCSVLNMMEQNPLIERYAWFIPRTNKAVDTPPYMQLLTHTSPSELTEAGKIYTSFSTFDKSVWLDANRVSAKDYTAICHNHIQIRTAENGEGMMVSDIRQNEWTEYQVYSVAAQTFTVSYATVVETSLLVYVDEKLEAVVAMPKTGSMTTWQTAAEPIAISDGKHVVRILVGSGAANINWFGLN